MAGKSYTNDIAQNPLLLTTIVLTGSDLALLNDNPAQLTFRLNNLAISGTSWNTIAIDNFAYTTTAVPEPSVTALIAGGAILGFVMMRRRRTLR